MAAKSLFTASGAPPPLARAPALAASLSSRGPRALFTASGAPPPLARAPALAASLSSRGPQALFTASGAPLSLPAAGTPPPPLLLGAYSPRNGSRLALARAPALAVSPSAPSAKADVLTRPLLLAVVALVPP